MTIFDYCKKTNRFTLKSDYFDQIREHFSCANDNAKFIKRFNPYVKQRLYAITPTGLYNIGMYNQIKEFLLKNQQFDIELTDSFRDAITMPIAYSVKHITNDEYKVRDYQDDALIEVLKHGRGICLMGTGAGKTLTMSLLIENLYNHFGKNMSAIVIVPDLGLATQTYNDFKDYKLTCTYSKWTGSEDYKEGSNIIIANSANILSKYEDNEWIKHIDFLIVDEVHKLGKSTAIDSVLNKIKTLHKFGFTGTLPTKKEDEWNVVGKFGPVVYEKSSFELRNEGYLTNVNVKAINIEYNAKPVYVKNEAPTKNYHIELDFLSCNPFRNKIIQKICSNFNNNVLILVNHIKHGEELHNILSKITGKKVYFVRGEVEIDDREKIKHAMEKNDNVVCIAISAIFSTGINIKNIHMVIFAAGGKSFIRTVQSIGRGLRLNNNKTQLTIIDIADKLKYSSDHFEQRKQFYVKEKIDMTVTNLAESA